MRLLNKKYEKTNLIVFVYEKKVLYVNNLYFKSLKLPLNN